MKFTARIRDHVYSMLVLSLTGCSIGITESAGPEIRMVRCLMAIRDVQNEFYSAELRFGTLPEVLPRVVQRTSQEEVVYCMRKYVVRLEIQLHGYRICAGPAPKSLARRSFFMDQSGVIRESWGPESATENSAVVK